MSEAVLALSPCTYLEWRETLPYHTISRLLYLAPCYVIIIQSQAKILLNIITMFPYSLRLFGIQVTSVRRHTVLICQL
jgi:hypothetical protein